PLSVSVVVAAGAVVFVMCTGRMVCGCCGGMYTLATPSSAREARLSALRRSCLGADVVPARLDVPAWSRIGIADATGAASARIASAVMMMRVVVEVMAGSFRGAAYSAPSIR